MRIKTKSETIHFKNGFTFLEALIALSLVGLIFLTGSSFARSLFLLWEKVEDLPNFREHYVSVSGLLNSMIDAEVNNPLKSRQISWGRVEGIKKNLVEFRTRNPSQLFVTDPESPSSDLILFLYYHESDGLSFIWKNLARGSKQRDWIRTPVSSMIEQVEFVFVDPETGEEEIELDTDESENDFEVNPSAMRIYFASKGRKHTEEFLFNSSFNNLPEVLLY